MAKNQDAKGVTSQDSGIPKNSGERFSYLHTPFGDGLSLDKKLTPPGGSVTAKDDDDTE